MITDVLLLMIQAIAVIGIAVMFFPVQKRRSEGMALGFVGARIIEGVLVVAGALSALILYGVELPGAIQGILTAPIGVNEMVLAIWLIAKGFNPAPRFAARPDREIPAA